MHCTDIPCVWVLQTMDPLQGPCGPDTAAPSGAGDARAARIFREIWWFTNLKVGLNHEKRVGFERIMGIFFLGTPWLIIKLSTYTWSNLVPGVWQLLFCYKWRNSSCQFCAGYPKLPTCVCHPRFNLGNGETPIIFMCQDYMIINEIWDFPTIMFIEPKGKVSIHAQFSPIQSMVRGWPCSRTGLSW